MVIDLWVNSISGRAAAKFLDQPGFGEIEGFFGSDVRKGTSRSDLVGEMDRLGVDRGRDYGRAEFGVRVAELGTPPATLTLLSEMLPDPEEDFSKLLVAAAIASIGVH